jgi:hypothetical protein
LTNAKSKEITDLQTGDHRYDDERDCSCGLATRDSDPDGDGDYKQNGWSQDEHGETLSKRHPDQKYENRKQHLERTF